MPFLLVPVDAQQPLAFDVVSIKRTPPGTKGGGVQNPTRQSIARSYAIRSLIMLAYRIAGHQIGDLPGRTDDISERNLPPA